MNGRNEQRKGKMQNGFASRGLTIEHNWADVEGLVLEDFTNVSSFFP
jgi:hypothetical protein